MLYSLWMITWIHTHMAPRVLVIWWWWWVYWKCNCGLTKYTDCFGKMWFLFCDWIGLHWVLCECFKEGSALSLGWCFFAWRCWVMFRWTQSSARIGTFKQGAPRAHSVSTTTTTVIPTSLTKHQSMLNNDQWWMKQTIWYHLMMIVIIGPSINQSVNQLTLLIQSGVLITHLSTLKPATIYQSNIRIGMFIK